MTIYEELTMAPANKNVIPSNENMTFTEQSVFVAEYANIELTKLFESIGIEELAIYESTGELVVYEGAKLSEFKQKIKDFFERIWEVIKAAYDKIVEFFETKINEIKSKISSKLFLSKVEKIPADKEYGKVHEYTLEKIESDVIDPAHDFLDEIPEIYGKAMKNIAGKSNSEIIKIAKESKEEIENKIYKVFGANDKSSSEIKSSMMKKFVSEKTIPVTKTWLIKNAKEISDVCLASGYKKDITKAYNGEKKLIDKAIKSAQLNAKECDDMGCTRYLIDSYKTLSTCLHTACNAYADIMKKRYHEYLIIITKVAFAKTEG